MWLGVFLWSFGVAQWSVAAELGGPAWLLAWPGGSAALLGTAYFAGRPAWLGKQPDGTISPVGWALFAPYFFFTWAVWELQKRLAREDASNEVAPGVHVARRIRGHEVPGAHHVVDMTAEFPAPSSLRSLPGYRCLPTLDATAPAADAARVLVESLVADGRPVVVHCAQGHGRSATLAALILIRRGLADDVEAAEAFMRKARPGIALKDAQKRLVRAVTATWRQP